MRQATRGGRLHREDDVRRIYRIASALAASATVAALVTGVGAGVKFGW